MRLVYRTMRPGDRDFVIGNWLASYRKSHTAGMIPMDQWQPIMSPIFNRIVDLPDARTLVVADTAIEPGLPDLFGFIVWREAVSHTVWRDSAEHIEIAPLVYFVYVKYDYRGNGFARGLMRAAGIDPSSAFIYACETRASLSLQEKRKLPRARWRPLVGRRLTEEVEYEQRQE